MTRLALAALVLLGAAQEGRRPNVVVFLVDDLGVMDIGAYNPRTFYETPHVDRLAASGMRFDAGYAASPVCSPTRYSLMTGKYPTRGAATNYFSGKREGRFKPAAFSDRMEPAETTLAEALKGAGYATFFAGKWHLGPDDSYFPTAQGFDVNRGGHHAGGPYTGNKYFSPFKNPKLEDTGAEEHLPDRLASETVKFIEEKKGGPFFAYLSFYSVHTPLMGRPDLVEKYKAKAAAVSGEEFADEEQVWAGGPARKVRVLQKHAVYAAMVEAMDAAVGKVLEALDRLKLADDTIVWFTSDNGGLSTSEGSPTSNLPYRGGKGWVYEGGIREPFVVRWPGVTKPGSTCDVPVISADLFPTIATAAGAAPGKVDGRDLRPLLEGGRLDRDALFWHYPHYSNQGGFPGGAVRSGDWKLVERYEDGRVHLYDLKNDPGERADLAERHPERVAALRARLHAWYKDVGARFLEPKDGRTPWRP